MAKKVVVTVGEKTFEIDSREYSSYPKTKIPFAATVNGAASSVVFTEGRRKATYTKYFAYYREEGTIFWFEIGAPGAVFYPGDGLGARNAFIEASRAGKLAIVDVATAKPVEAKPEPTIADVMAMLVKLGIDPATLPSVAAKVAEVEAKGETPEGAVAAEVAIPVSEVAPDPIAVAEANATVANPEVAAADAVVATEVPEAPKERAKRK